MYVNGNQSKLSLPPNLEFVLIVPPSFPKISQNWPIYEKNSLLKRPICEKNSLFNQFEIAMIEMTPRNMRLTSWGVKWSQWKRRSWLSKLWMNDGNSPRKIRCIHILFNFLGNWKNGETDGEDHNTINAPYLSCLSWPILLVCLLLSAPLSLGANVHQWQL